MSADRQRALEMVDSLGKLRSKMDESISRSYRSELKNLSADAMGAPEGRAMKRRNSMPSIAGSEDMSAPTSPLPRTISDGLSRAGVFGRRSRVPDGDGQASSTWTSKPMSPTQAAGRRLAGLTGRGSSSSSTSPPNASALSSLHHASVVAAAVDSAVTSEPAVEHAPPLQRRASVAGIDAGQQRRGSIGSTAVDIGHARRVSFCAGVRRGSCPSLELGGRRASIGTGQIAALLASHKAKDPLPESNEIHQGSKDSVEERQASKLRTGQDLVWIARANNLPLQVVREADTIFSAHALSHGNVISRGELANLLCSMKSCSGNEVSDKELDQAFVFAERRNAKTLHFPGFVSWYSTVSFQAGASNKEDYM